MIKKLKDTLDADKQVTLIIRRLKKINDFCPEIWIERDIEKLENNMDALSEGFNSVSDELKAEIRALRDVASHPHGIRDQIPIDIEPREWQQMADDLVRALDAYMSDR